MTLCCAVLCCVVLCCVVKVALLPPLSVSFISSSSFELSYSFLPLFLSTLPPYPVPSSILTPLFLNYSNPDVNNRAAILAAKAATDKPSIIKIRTVIGFGSTKQGTGNCPSTPLPSCPHFFLPFPPFMTFPQARKRFCI